MDIPREAIELSYEREGFETVQAKRELGNGRWDKILMRRMVELSIADNYNEAKEEGSLHIYILREIASKIIYPILILLFIVLFKYVIRKKRRDKRINN